MDDKPPPEPDPDSDAQAADRIAASRAHAQLEVVILAAGRGSRMRSRTPKVLHALCGQPMLQWVLDAARALSAAPPLVVVAPGADAVTAQFAGRARFCCQAQPRGTGDAVAQAQGRLADTTRQVLVLCGDMPLLPVATLRALIRRQAERTQGGVALLTTDRPASQGFGRIVRDERGGFRAIVEEKLCTPAQRTLTELNAGAYVFEPGWLFQAAARLAVQADGERYVTDLPRLAREDGLAVETCAAAPEDVLGVNTRAELALATAALRRRINAAHMDAGVSFTDPQAAYVDAGVRIGPDTLIAPGTMLTGRTHIDEGCEIGPAAHLHDCRIGAECRIQYAVMEGTAVGSGCRIGPFARLRAGARLEARVYMGSFGEVKNSALGADAHMGHFSYVGDADVGAGVNVGAGTITCNFDGQRKHRTIIEDEAFLGSGTKLVAPLRVGPRARTGAGAVVTRDVPADALVYGVPAKPAPDPGERAREAEEAVSES